MTTTRRLAAILAADIAGYSAAMERDEEGTAAAVRALRREVIEPKLAEHQGRLIKTTGDGFLAEFASPIAALKCALAIQQRPVDRGGLQLRIGLNLGDVIIEEGGDLLGEGVNVAARLESLAEPGGILISGKIYSEVEGKVEAAFEDRGEQQVKNISRPVRVYAVRTGPMASAAISESSRPLPLPDKPSIAVLPFQNMSGDPEQEYFADGMVEDIITALSRFKQLFVIARNSSFTYKSKAVDIKRVGRELGVRYVLEGSVRKAGGRVRITGQLIEAATGAHLWADKFDGALEGIFDLQDQLTASVVGAILPALQHAEIERTKRKPPADLDGYDWYLRGTAFFNANRSRDALPCYRAAIEGDAGYADAYAMVASCYVFSRAQQGVPLTPEEVAEALSHANAAIRLGDDNAFALARAAQTLSYLGDEYDRAAAIVEQALSLNSNLSIVWLARGWINLICGDADRAIESFSYLLRISPVDPQRSGAWNGLAWGNFNLGRYDEGLEWATKAYAVMKSPNVFTLATLIASAVFVGRLGDAREAAEQIRKIAPEFRIRHAHDLFPHRHAEFHEKIANALTAAGLPE
jgi:TolB-like protein/class 3 adenylate cyclase